MDLSLETSVHVTNLSELYRFFQRARNESSNENAGQLARLKRLMNQIRFFNVYDIQIFEFNTKSNRETLIIRKNLGNLHIIQLLRCQGFHLAGFVQEQ